MYIIDPLAIAFWKEGGGVNFKFTFRGGEGFKILSTTAFTADRFSHAGVGKNFLRLTCIKNFILTKKRLILFHDFVYLKTDALYKLEYENYNGRWHHLGNRGYFQTFAIITIEIFENIVQTQI